MQIRFIKSILFFSDQHIVDKDQETNAAATYSRPLRTSFCKALVRMSHLSADFNNVPPKKKYSDAELRLGIESAMKKTVQVLLIH